MELPRSGSSTHIPQYPRPSLVWHHGGSRKVGMQGAGSFQPKFEAIELYCSVKFVWPGKLLLVVSFAVTQYTEWAVM